MGTVFHHRRSITTNFIRRLVPVAILVMLPVVASGCGQPAVQPSTSQTVSNTSVQSYTGNTVTYSTSSKTSSIVSDRTTHVPSSSPDATRLFKDIQHSSSPGKSINVSHVQSIAKNLMEQSVQQVSLKPSEKALVKPYIAQMESLQSQYATSLYSLYDQAKAEYHTGQKSKLQIENEYVPQVIRLEDSAQSQVNVVLFALRDALVAQGYSTDEVNVLRNAYYSAVSQMESTLGKG